MNAHVNKSLSAGDLACSAAINLAVLLLFCLTPVSPIRKTSAISQGTRLTHVTFHKPSMAKAAPKPPQTAKVMAVSTFTKSIAPPRPTKPEVSSLTQPSKFEAAAPRGEMPAPHAVTATPGTARWSVLVANGKSSDLAIIAEDSLPVLRSFGVSLAFDLRRPRGTSFLFNLAERQLHRAAVPGDYIVRELENMPPEFGPILQQAEQALGAPPHIYALYPPELYGAMRSMTLEALQEKRVPVTEETRAHIRMQLGRNGSFSVTLISS